MRFRGTPESFVGSIAAMVTPFTGDGTVDHASLARMVAWQVASGSHGVSLGGSTGEPSAQTVAERAAAIRTVAAAVDDRVPFLAGTGTGRLPETLELTQAAADAGADGVLVVTPYYAKPTQPALQQWYDTVCREFPDLPVIAYNVPTRTAVDIAPETVAALFARHENFIGIKETTFDFAHFSRVMQLAGPRLAVWSGIELLCLPLLALGGVGFISATSNLAPAASAQMYQRWCAGDLDGAREIHFGLHPLVDALFVETNPAPAKYLMHRQGLIASPFVRPPLLAPGPQARHRIRQLADRAARYLTPVDAAQRDGTSSHPAPETGNRP